MASAALIALSVGHAAAEGTDEVKQTVGASIHMETDSDNQENYDSGTRDEYGFSYEYNGDFITQEVIDAVSKVDGVVAYSAESSDYWGSAIDFEYFPGAFNFGDSYNPSSYTVTFNSALNRKFMDGTYTLMEGRHIQEDDSFAVMISKELADKNDLSVGDHISMYDLDTDSENTFEIVGIFSGTEGMSKDAMMSNQIPANQGYIDMNSYQKIWNETVLELGSLEIYVDSAANVEDILKTIQNLPEIKGKTFTFSTDTADFDLISNPLSSLQKMVNTAVTVIAITGAAIITLLLILWTRGRKKEAGILMAVGRSKVEIVLQFLSENLFIAIPAAAASFGLSALLADQVGAFLVSQTASDVHGLSVVIHSADMAAVYGIGALILILAVLAASVAVIRLKPKAILTQMD
ncbi:ABC transporter permease [Massilioclostridium coli]|uniref:ABC transporter permease n=1 Tax=Massilioclostridium coli TaxID=1870991 RepID=UPI001F171D9F|nr:ABC transporter permease [Massilioclostridium coli]